MTGTWQPLSECTEAKRKQVCHILGLSKNEGMASNHDLKYVKPTYRTMMWNNSDITLQWTRAPKNLFFL